MYTGNMDKSKIKCLLRSFKNGSTNVDACKAVDIHVSTLWRWCEKWPDLAKKIEQIKQKRTTFVVDAIYNNAINGKEASQKLWMINNGGWKSGDGNSVKVDVPVSVENNTKVNIPVATPQEAERVKRYAELIRKHNLVSRALGSDGHELVLGVELEGQQRDSSVTGGDPSGDPLAHTGMQEIKP